MVDLVMAVIRVLHKAKISYLVTEIGERFENGTLRVNTGQV